jgi:hypothetical protein
VGAWAAGPSCSGSTLGIFSFAIKDNDDIATWMRLLPKQTADRTGAAVLLVDQVTKDCDTRGRFAIGGQAKRAALTGAAYTVEVAEPVGIGLRGAVVLGVAKDRPGYVRGRCGPMRKSDRTRREPRGTALGHGQLSPKVVHKLEKHVHVVWQLDDQLRQDTIQPPRWEPY